ncbi:MAG: Dna2/Cas4 domain-containing protein [Methanomicrobia archaeon]|nr:Dna2/Cas4 domain-containing protein [Methanomicrobia archaeon]
MLDTQDRSTLVKVSELTHYLLCPRLVYFNAQGKQQPAHVQKNDRSAIEHALFKELGFSWQKLCLGDQENVPKSRDRKPDEAIAQTLAEITDDLELIYKNELGSVSEDLLERVKTDFVTLISTSEWLGRLQSNDELALLERSFGFERERSVISQRLGLVGSMDKLIRTGDEHIPCIIKTGRCPAYSVWKRDRMQLAAYALLLEDAYETTVQRGFVEYIRAPEVRTAVIKRGDRALALQTVKRVKRVKNGLFPDKGEHAPCEHCAFAAQCETRRTLLSRLLMR